MGDWYNGGTIAVENGSASVVGTTTLFNTKIKVGDSLVTLQSDVLRINQVTAIDDDNNLAIDPAWAGTTGSGLTYNVIPTSRLWGEVSTAARDLSNFLANISTFFPTDGKPTDDEGGDGSFAVDPNSTPPKLYVKTDGAWDNGTSLGGPTGATGAGYGGTSTDSKILANSGSMSFETQTGLAWQSGSRIRIASATAPTTKWMEGIITAYSSGTLTVTIDKQGSGSGSASDWTFSSAGEPGVKGDTGAKGDTGNTGNTGATGLGYGGTSTTSRAINNAGTMTWTIGTGKAYQVGDLVKIVVTTDDTQWMKGIVSGYSAGVLSVDINEKGPDSTGTFASWNIGLAGETGSQGPQGDASTIPGPSLNPRGDYDSGTAYAEYDVVLDQRSSWVALQDTTGNDPPTLPITSDSNWQLLAQHGEDGSGIGDVVGPSSATDQRLAAFDGSTGKLLADSGVTAADIISAAVAAATSPHNRCINPVGLYAQAGFAAAADGSYSGFDQWYVLTQSGTVLCSQLTNVADGLPTMMRMTQSQASAQRMGFAQVFESSVVKDLRGKTVTLSAKVRMSAATTLRYAIIEWTGTADTVTKDVVASWTNTTFAAGQFFSGTSLTIAATGSIVLSASTVTDILLKTTPTTISSSMNNLIIFFWTDSAQAQTVTLDIGNVFFGQGDAAPAAYDPPNPADDLIACQRYLQIWSGAAATSIPVCLCYSQSTTSARGVQPFLVRMRVPPSVSYSAAGDFQASFASGFPSSAISAGVVGTDAVFHIATCSGLTASQAGVLRNSSTSALITFDARL